MLSPSPSLQSIIKSWTKIMVKLNRFLNAHPPSPSLPLAKWRSHIQGNECNLCVCSHLKRSGWRKDTTRTARLAEDCQTCGKSSVKEYLSDGAKVSPAHGGTSKGAAHYAADNVISDSGARVSSEGGDNIRASGNTTDAIIDNGVANDGGTASFKGMYIITNNKR